jgi:hypothetical protein
MWLPGTAAVLPLPIYWLCVDPLYHYLPGYFLHPESQAFALQQTLATKPETLLKLFAFVAYIYHKCISGGYAINSHPVINRTGLTGGRSDDSVAYYFCHSINFSVFLF